MLIVRLFSFKTLVIDTQVVTFNRNLFTELEFAIFSKQTIRIRCVQMILQNINHLYQLIAITEASPLIW